jgi:hypothetical protein
MPERRSVPVWVRTLDVLGFLRAAVSAIVAGSGNFRARFGGLPVAVTSPLPLLLWCAVFAIGRHVAAAQPPLYREFPTGYVTSSRRPAVLSADAVGAALFYTWRPLF